MHIPFSMSSTLSSWPSTGSVSLLGKEIPRSSVEKVLYSATAFLVLFNAVMVPFALPKLRRFLGAPYLPSSRTAFRLVFEHVPELQRPGLRMVDVGSGDGRLLQEASKFGMQVLGVEMNPWLVLVSRFRLRKEREANVLWANAWESTERIAQFGPDFITFYGRPGQGLLRQFGALAESVSDISGKTIWVASNKFPIPGWQVRQIAEIGDFHIYKLHSNRT